MSPSTSSLSRTRYPIQRCIVNPNPHSNDDWKLTDELLPECRAFRLVKNDTRRFLLVSFTKEAREGDIEVWMREYTQSGVELMEKNG